MEVWFTIGASDLAALYQFFVRERKAQLLNLGAACIGASWLPLVMTAAVSIIWGYENKVALTGLVILSIISFVAVFIPLLRGSDAETSRQSGSVGEHYARLDINGITQRAEKHEIIYKWSAIKRIEATDSHIFLFSDYGIIVIPARAFPGIDDAIRFRDHAIGLWQQATRGGAA